jgi:hypothetical protein
MLAITGEGKTGIWDIGTTWEKTNLYFKFVINKTDIKFPLLVLEYRLI